MTTEDNPINKEDDSPINPINKEIILKTKDVNGITFRLSTILEWNDQHDKIECNNYYLTFVKDNKTYWIDAWTSLTMALAAFSKIYAIGGADV